MRFFARDETHWAVFLGVGQLRPIPKNTEINGRGASNLAQDDSVRGRQHPLVVHIEPLAFNVQSVVALDSLLFLSNNTELSIHL